MSNQSGLGLIHRVETANAQRASERMFPGQIGLAREVREVLQANGALARDDGKVKDLREGLEPEKCEEWLRRDLDRLRRAFERAS